MEKKYPIDIEPNISKHQDIIFKVCKMHGVKSLELTTKHIALMSDCISEYIAQLKQTDPDALTIADYEESLTDHRCLVREIDVILNGDNAAKQASLCDLVGQIKELKGRESAVWVKASNRLPGYTTPVQWRDGNDHTHTTSGKIALIDMAKPFLVNWEWFDESAVSTNTTLTSGAPTTTGTYFAVIKGYVNDEPQMCVLHYRAHKNIYKAAGHAFNLEIRAEDVVGYVNKSK